MARAVVVLVPDLKQRESGHGWIRLGGRGGMEGTTEQSRNDREEGGSPEMSRSPFGGRGFYDPHSEVNRLFDEAFANLGRAGGRQQGEGPTQWAPALDVLHEGEDLFIRAELPGVRLEDVEITLRDRVLTISGERRAEEQREGSSYYVRERRHGAFRRSVVLPHDVEEDQIGARFEGGVLEVRVPGGAAERGPRRIRIEGSGGEGASG